MIIYVHAYTYLCTHKHIHSYTHIYTHYTHTQKRVISALHTHYFRAAHETAVGAMWARLGGAGGGMVGVGGIGGGGMGGASSSSPVPGLQSLSSFLSEQAALTAALGAHLGLFRSHVEVRVCAWVCICVLHAISLLPQNTHTQSHKHHIYSISLQKYIYTCVHYTHTYTQIHFTNKHTYT